MAAGAPPGSVVPSTPAHKFSVAPRAGVSAAQERPHPVFDLPILHAWAAAQEDGLRKFLRLFRALDGTLCATCSVEDFRYVALAALGRGVLSREQQHVLCAAFRAAPRRDAASRANGTHERVACAAPCPPPRPPPPTTGPSRLG